MRRMFLAALLGTGIALSGCGHPDLAPSNFQTAVIRPQQTQPSAYLVTGSGTFVPRSGQSQGFTVSSNLVVTVEAKNELAATGGSITITDLNSGQALVLTPANILDVDLQPRFHAADGSSAQGPVAAAKGKFSLLVDAQVPYQGQLTKLNCNLFQSPRVPEGLITNASFDVGDLHDNGRLASGSFTLTPIP